MDARAAVVSAMRKKVEERLCAPRLFMRFPPVNRSGKKPVVVNVDDANVSEADVPVVFEPAPGLPIPGV